MRHPMLSVERVASVTGEMVIVETAVDMLNCGRPAMAFYPSDEMARDATNWCGPNPQAVIAMLEVAGFKRFEIVAGLPPLWFRIASGAYFKWKRGQSRLWSRPIRLLSAATRRRRSCRLGQN